MRALPSHPSGTGGPCVGGSGGGWAAGQKAGTPRDVPPLMGTHRVHPAPREGPRPNTGAGEAGPDKRLCVALRPG